MAINNINTNVNNNAVDANKLAQQPQVAQQQASAKPNAAVPVRQDSVSLTQSAQQLSQVQKQRSSEAPVDQEKVDKLKKAIQSGEYKVDAQSLAQKIARLEAQIFGSNA